MVRRIAMLLTLCTALLLTGCAMTTVGDMYSLPKRSKAYNNLQAAIDEAMISMEYAAPSGGENQQTVQQVDLDGDGQEEYLLFARGTSEKPLQILVFRRTQDHYTLLSSIEMPGFSFEQVEYADMDDRPGKEIVVGCQLSDQVARSLSVYTFSAEQPEQLLSVNYAKFLTCDMDDNGRQELMLLLPGESESNRGVAVSYRWENGEMKRSAEAELSGPVDAIRRIAVGFLESGERAVYVASAVEDSAIVTDIFALADGKFQNISFSSEAETSVRTLRDYYVYADDIDYDGILELPSLLPISSDDRQGMQQYLIRWFSMDRFGTETDKRYTYHNFAGGWYLELSEEMASDLYVTQTANQYAFWIGQGASREPILTIFALTGPNREDQALETGRFVLRRGDGILYAARLESGAYGLAMGQEEIINRFHLIHHDWKTGET